jgi:hypothetical protein
LFVRIFGALVLALVGFGCAGSDESPESPASRDARAAMDTAKRWEEAWLTGQSDVLCSLMSGRARLEIAQPGTGCAGAISEFVRGTPKALLDDLAPRPASVRIRGDIATLTLKVSSIGKRARPPLLLVREGKSWRIGINRPLVRWNDRETCVAGTFDAMRRDPFWDSFDEPERIEFGLIYCEAVRDAPDEFTDAERTEITHGILRELGERTES